MRSGSAVQAESFGLPLALVETRSRDGGMDDAPDWDGKGKVVRAWLRVDSPTVLA
jgi:hypothetical protein